MEANNLVLACSLTSTQFQERRANVLQKLGAAVLEVHELEYGYSYRFPPDDEWLQALTQVVQLERDCCTFLQFQLTLAPQHGPIWLAITGPSEMKVALGSFFS